jgi:anti-anti-sigma factor
MHSIPSIPPNLNPLTGPVLGVARVRWAADAVIVPLDTLHVLHAVHGDVHVVSFRRDEAGHAALEPIKHYFSSAFLEHTADWHRLVIDLSGVQALDSSCLGPLVQKFRLTQKASGRLVLCGVTSPALEEIFALTRFDKVFPITRECSEAIPLAAT